MSADSSNTTAVLKAALGQQCERVRQRIHVLVEPVSQEDLWRKPYPYGNSVGHLVLHLTGNLSYYIGAQIAGTGYVRDRPKEFADDSRREKADILQAFDAAVDLMLKTLDAQGDEDWSAPFQAVGVDDMKDRISIFIRCAAHLDHHMGQIIYLWPSNSN